MYYKCCQWQVLIFTFTFLITISIVTELFWPVFSLEKLALKGPLELTARWLLEQIHQDTHELTIHGLTRTINNAQSILYIHIFSFAEVLEGT